MYQVIQCDLQGRFVAVVSGLGRHRRTWDSTHTRSTAYRHAKALQTTDKQHIYAVLPVNG
jgi:hypothetical protein